jgi:hypothetical protein
MNWFHRHGPWDIVGASCDGKLHVYDPGGMHPFQYSLITYVAQRCKGCGEIRTKMLPGRFTMEQIRGEDSEVSLILARMEKEEGGEK